MTRGKSNENEGPLWISHKNPQVDSGIAHNQPQQAVFSSLKMPATSLEHLKRTSHPNCAADLVTKKQNINQIRDHFADTIFHITFVCQNFQLLFISLICDCKISLHRSSYMNKY